MNLLSSLVLSCLSSSVFPSLSLSVTVFFLSLCHCLCLRVVLCVMLCCVVLWWCVVLWCCMSCVTRWKNPCVHSTRLRVYVQNVPVFTGTTRTHVSTCVRVVLVQTGTFWTYTRRRFSSVKQVVFDSSWASLTDVGFISYRQFFCLPWMAHIWVITCLRGSPKKPLRVYPFKVWEQVEHGTFPSPSIIRFTWTCCWAPVILIVLFVFRPRTQHNERFARQYRHQSLPWLYSSWAACTIF